jgi:sugar lactone lactonase YvrE
MKKIFLSARIIVIACFAMPALAQNLITVAGNGQNSYGGNGGPASTAAFNGPTGIFFDPPSSYLYVCDANNNVVRTINTAAIVTNYAGNGFGAGTGTGGYTGDGNPATSAELFIPQGIVRDTFGNTYVADAGNHVVRKINASGVITTFAGTGTAGSGGDGSPATGATLNFPVGVAIDTSGNVYISDFNANVVRKVNTSGIISTIAGTGTAGYNFDGVAATTAQLNAPTHIVVDAHGTLYICDDQNHRIRKVNLTTGIINTMVGTGTPGNSGDHGPASTAQINLPRGIAIDHSGNLYFTDVAENVIRKVSIMTDTITALAGTAGVAGYSGDGGPATAATLNQPDGITADATGDVFFCDRLSKVVRRILSDGTISTVAGHDDSLFCGDGGPALQAELDSPMASAYDAAGNLYIADYGNNCVRVMSPGGNIETFAGDALAGPGFSGDGGPATAAKLNHPKGVATDAAGNVYISDAGNSALRVVHTSGNISTIAGTPGTVGYSGDGGSALSAKLNDPTGIIVDSVGNVYFSDAGNNALRVVHTSGNIDAVAGNGTPGSGGDGGAASAAQLVYPMGLAFDKQGNLYIADSGAARVRVIHTSGNISTFAGTGTRGYSGDGAAASSAELTAPMGVVVDDTGNVHISDGGNARIRIVHTSGNISTYVGTGVPGFNGDGPVGSAQLNMPVGLTKDQAGYIYVTDRKNDRVRKFVGVGPLSVISTSNLESKGLVVYPNPGKENFVINYTSASNTPLHYILMDLLGRKITEGNAATNQVFELHVSVQPGVYLLNATTGDSREAARIVVE